MLPGGEKTPRGNVKKTALFKKKCPSPFPPPAAKTPRLEGAALLHLLPAVRHRRSRPHPSARATPWDSRAARSFASAHAACTRPRGNGDSRCAAVQQELHSERQPAPAAVHRKTPLAGSPRRSDPCDPLARPFCRTALGRRSVHPQRAAPCTAHRSYKTSIDTPHLRRRAHSPPPPFHTNPCASRNYG